MKPVQFNVQTKGGSGKSMLTYAGTQKNKRADRSHILLTLIVQSKQVCSN